MFSEITSAQAWFCSCLPHPANGWWPGCDGWLLFEAYGTHCRLITYSIVNLNILRWKNQDSQTFLLKRICLRCSSRLHLKKNVNVVLCQSLFALLTPHLIERYRPKELHCKTICNNYSLIFFQQRNDSQTTVNESASTGNFYNEDSNPF